MAGFKYSDPWILFSCLRKLGSDPLVRWVMEKPTEFAQRFGDNISSLPAEKFLG